MSRLLTHIQSFLHFNEEVFNFFHQCLIYCIVFHILEVPSVFYTIVNGVTLNFYLESIVTVI